MRGKDKRKLEYALVGLGKASACVEAIPEQNKLIEERLVKIAKDIEKVHNQIVELENDV